MCSGSEAGSYLRLTDVVYHSTLGLRVIKQKKKTCCLVWAADAAGSLILKMSLGMSTDIAGDDTLHPSPYTLHPTPYKARLAWATAKRVKHTC